MQFPKCFCVAKVESRKHGVERSRRDRFHYFQTVSERNTLFVAAGFVPGKPVDTTKGYRYKQIFSWRQILE